MISASIENTIRNQIAENVYVRSIENGRYVVAVPMTLDDGDSCDLILRQKEDSLWIVDDNGATIDRAREYGVDLLGTKHAPKLTKLVDGYGASVVDGKLCINVEMEDFSCAIFAMTQLRLEAAHLVPRPQEKIEHHPRVVDRIGSLLATRISPQRLVRNWHHPSFDPGGAFPVDWHVQSSRGDEWLFFGVDSNEHCWQSSATCLFLRSKEAKFRAVAAFDDTKKISEKSKSPLLSLVSFSFVQPTAPGLLDLINEIGR